MFPSLPDADRTGIISRVNTLEARVEQTNGLEAIRKAEIHRGDWVLVTTRNSLYCILALGDDQYAVSGGWFDREGVSPAKTTVNGCTWGGTAIKHDVIAARGLFLEFGNHVTTTRIKKIRVIHGGGEPDANALRQ